MARNFVGLHEYALPLPALQGGALAALEGVEREEEGGESHDPRQRPMRVPAKEYLGDAVYAEDIGYGIVLTTENGYGPTNTIVLEQGVVAALLQFLKRADRIPDAVEAGR